MQSASEKSYNTELKAWDLETDRDGFKFSFCRLLRYAGLGKL